MVLPSSHQGRNTHPGAIAAFAGIGARSAKRSGRVCMSLRIGPGLTCSFTLRDCVTGGQGTHIIAERAVGNASAAPRQGSRRKGAPDCFRPERISSPRLTRGRSALALHRPFAAETVLVAKTVEPRRGVVTICQGRARSPADGRLEHGAGRGLRACGDAALRASDSVGPRSLRLTSEGDLREAVRKLTGLVTRAQTAPEEARRCRPPGL